MILPIRMRRSRKTPPGSPVETIVQKCRRSFYRRQNGHALTGCLVQSGISLPYNLQLVPYWTAFMLLGANAGQQKLFDLPALSGGSRWGLGIALLVIGTALSL